MTQHHQIDIDELFRQRDEYSRQAARMRTALKKIAEVNRFNTATLMPSEVHQIAVTALKD